jgi:hypothetical protein
MEKLTVAPRASIRAKVCDVIYSRPEITQLELARCIYGPFAYPGLIKAVCRDLLREGRIFRAGKGGASDPFRYSWACKRDDADGDIWANRREHERTAFLRTSSDENLSGAECLPHPEVRQSAALE